MKNYQFFFLAFWLSGRNLWHHLRSTLLSICLVAFGVGLLVFSFLLTQTIEEAVLRNARGISVVLGAKGSPLQLVLSAVFHLDRPTGNISASAAKTFSKHPLVKKAIPLLYGDNINGARLLGTTPDYMALYGASLAHGRTWQKSMEAVAGAGIAAKMNWKIGQHLESAHGLSGDEAHEHAHHFVLVGILAPNGTVLDGLVLTSPQSVWDLHHGQDTSSAYTALLLKARNPLATLNLPRIINQQPNLQAASPAQEIATLAKSLGLGRELIENLAFVLLFLAFAGIFLGLYGIQISRMKEWQTLRQLGLSLNQILSLLLLEFGWLGLLGSSLGVLLGHLGIASFLTYVQSQFFFFWPKWVFYEAEISIWFLGLIICMPLALFSSFQVYKQLKF
ncbi:MAG: FtsX-like permease family protein [Cytophagales bacterium]|nr:MAG: FtsX-like permease family protein [Cytophagales bacterium]TAF59257.1 MAG: FtsX-like permease family protein [Cytophagales bacterium]